VTSLHAKTTTGSHRCTDIRCGRHNRINHQTGRCIKSILAFEYSMIKLLLVVKPPSHLLAGHQCLFHQHENGASARNASYFCPFSPSTRANTEYTPPVEGSAVASQQCGYEVAGSDHLKSNTRAKCRLCCATLACLVQVHLVPTSSQKLHV
jgi:hypothetical protein